MRAEIRCCCDTHLVGWIEVEALRHRERYHFCLRSEPTFIDDGDDVRPRPPETITFECSYLQSLLGAKWLALKSRDYPIVQLRRIPGFVEAPKS